MLAVEIDELSDDRHFDVVVLEVTLKMSQASCPSKTALNSDKLNLARK